MIKFLHDTWPIFAIGVGLFLVVAAFCWAYSSRRRERAWQRAWRQECDRAERAELKLEDLDE